MHGLGSMQPSAQVFAQSVIVVIVGIVGIVGIVVIVGIFFSNCIGLIVILL